MRNPKPVLGILAAAIILGLVAWTAGAATLHVRNNGVDTATCGAVAAPCRSISRGVANAAARDRILVGPGLYGDINGNGILGEPGEEAAGGIMILVNKPLTLESEAGAGATVIDAGTTDSGIIVVISGGSVIGTAGNGFTFSGGPGSAGLVTSNGSPFTSEMTASGNMAVNTQIGFTLFAGDVGKYTLTDNLAIRCFIGFLSHNGSGHAFKRNTAVGNQAWGFLMEGGGHSFADNLGIGNGYGWEIHGPADPAFTFTGNTAIGNTLAGLTFLDGAVATLTHTNIFGNGQALTNCGIFAAPGTLVNAPTNFFGAATGPGPDPADSACASPGSTLLVAPFAPLEFPIATTWR